MYSSNENMRVIEESDRREKSIIMSSKKAKSIVDYNKRIQVREGRAVTSNKIIKESLLSGRDQEK